MFEVKVILDSLSPVGKRLTTITATYPRFIHSEVMTHRDRARNAASSRAIPYHKEGSSITLRKQVLENPVIPLMWGSEQKGMQTGCEIEKTEEARTSWLAARDAAIKHADELFALGLHKSLINRIVEPWMWITVVMTATEWNNFFRLRCHPDAEIHFQKIACMIRDAMASSQPIQAPSLTAFAQSGSDSFSKFEKWHLPFVSGYDFEQLAASGITCDEVKQISAARCARVSYLTHEGVRDPKKDLELFSRLSDGSGFGHFSPYEHVAHALLDVRYRSGPFIGWDQYRKRFKQENLPG